MSNIYRVKEKTGVLFFLIPKFFSQSQKESLLHFIEEYKNEGGICEITDFNQLTGNSDFPIPLEREHCFLC